MHNEAACWGRPSEYIYSHCEFCALLTTLSQVELIRRDYTANGGWETFLSYEDPEQGEIIALSAPNYVILLFEV